MQLYVPILITIFSSIYRQTLQKITFQSSFQPTPVTPLPQITQVLVQAHFQQINNENYEKVHLCIRAANKHKKQAYNDLIHKYNSFVKKLIKIKAIPNKQSMIHSIVHRNYLRKSRRWQFFRYFVLYVHKSELSKILQNVSGFRAETVKTPLVVKYLDEKFMSIAAFIQAKRELEEFIKQKLNDQYKILLTKDIEISGKNFKNQQIIQNDIEAEFNDDKYEEEDSSTTIHSQTKLLKGYYNQAGSSKNKNISKLSIKVLFQIVDKYADVQQILEGIQMQEGESESISDFEDDGNENQNQNQKDQENEDESEDL